MTRVTPLGLALHADNEADRALDALKAMWDAYYEGQTFTYGSALEKAYRVLLGAALVKKIKGRGHRWLRDGT